mmetsp:Transcript_27130/g.68146  ORF Transcript_27130/g.68146 Transcript_27130/m.68146 type:complete len:260 (-) Transcript_27130:70-849(-)|eukprot:CAMPEP_0177640842 /NCGR_PEP_ID=MMETSP0447-20121125/6757_1 /TAXON_ID=0 /ORGANISM="Stygamoeba regulata, Strain BSH-02190019" /LENGTH=259 /DNA_ID=CAMNT_0019142937 /DNA_START=156 /DNA_END=935 /DNA_ORIENTATION=-
MLRNILILSGSGGGVLFEKAWVDSVVDSEKTRLLGGVITSFEEFAKQVVNMRVTYLEFGKFALSIVQDEHETDIVCALFHDVTDGEALGRLIATQLLAHFLDEYSAEDLNSPAAQHGDFGGFVSKIPDAIRQSITSILLSLSEVPLVRRAAIVYEDSRTHTVDGFEETEIGLAANLQAVLTFATEIMSKVKDRPQAITLQLTKNKIVYLHPLGRGSLVTICRQPTPYPTTGFVPSAQEDLQEHVDLLKRAFQLIANLSG